VSLRVTAKTREYLPWRSLPTNLSALRINNINILLYDTTPSELLATMHEFESVNAGFLWEDCGHLTLPRVRSLHLESTTMLNQDREHEDMDVSLLLQGHESIDSITNLYLGKVACTPAMTEAIQNMTGLLHLTIEACKIEEGSFADLCQILVQADGPTLPNLQTLPLCGSWPKQSSKDAKQLITEIRSRRPSLQILMDDRTGAPLRKGHDPSTS
jgi:hypothetical protein